MRRLYVVVLVILTFAFFLRVLGQGLVAFFQVGFLPALDAWYSGVLPYPILLPIQIVMLAMQAKISLDIGRGSGFFAVWRPRAGKILCWLSYVYAGGMVLRYILTMSVHPERRWFGGTIPIFFHLVLAAYLFVLGRFMLAKRNASDELAAEGAER